MTPERPATPAISEDEIARFVIDHFMDDDADLQDAEQDLLADGVIDSLGVLHVAAWLEKRYGVVLPNRELSSRNFRSVRAIREAAERAVAGGGTS